MVEDSNNIATNAINVGDPSLMFSYFSSLYCLSFLLPWTADVFAIPKTNLAVCLLTRWISWGNVGTMHVLAALQRSLVYQRIINGDSAWWRFSRFASGWTHHKKEEHVQVCLSWVHQVCNWPHFIMFFFYLTILLISSIVIKNDAFHV